MSAGIALLAVAASLPPICADRPAKATGTCTVPAGTLQVEAGLAGWSLTKIQGTRTELITLGSTVVKLGLSNHSDLQVGFTPHTKLKLSDAASRTRASGFGDLTVRYKASPNDRRYGNPGRSNSIFEAADRCPSNRKRQA